MKQLLTYYSLALFISWFTWFPLYSMRWGIHLPAVPFQHALGGLGPMIAALLTTGLFQKKAGLKMLLADFFRVRPLLLLAVALLSPFLLPVLASVIAALVDGTTVDVSGLMRAKEFPQFNLLQFFLYNLVFFGFGEEAGWRGFALPRLREKMNALNASLVLAVFWALWHLPLFLYRPGYVSMDLAGVMGWVFSMLTGSVLLTWLYNSSRGSILICAIFHATVDIAFTADFANKSIVGYMGFLITLWGIATIVFFKPGKRSIR